MTAPKEPSEHGARILQPGADNLKRANPRIVGHDAKSSDVEPAGLNTGRVTRRDPSLPDGGWPRRRRGSSVCSFCVPEDLRRKIGVPCEAAPGRREERTA